MIIFAERVTRKLKIHAYIQIVFRKNLDLSSELNLRT